MLRLLHGTNYDFIKYWKHAAIATVVFILAGMGLLVVHHARTGSAVNWNVEFTGGTFMQVSFKTKPDPSAVRDAVAAAGFNDAEVAAFGADTAFSIKAAMAGQTATVSSADSTAARIEAALHQKFGDSTQVRVDRCPVRRREGRRRAEAERDDRDPHLVSRHPDLPGDQIRMAIRSGRRRRHRARRAHDARRSSP